MMTPLVDLGGLPRQRDPEASGRPGRSVHAVGDLRVRLRPDLRPANLVGGLSSLRVRLRHPEVDDRALSGLEFSAALPRQLPSTLATRLADPEKAAAVLEESCRFTP